MPVRSPWVSASVEIYRHRRREEATWAVLTLDPWSVTPGTKEAVVDS